MKKKILNTMAKKLGFFVLILGLVMNILIAFLVYPAVYSVLKDTAIQNVEQLSDQSMRIIDHVMEQYELYSQFIGTDQYLYQQLELCKKDNSEQNREKLSAEFSSYMNHFSGLSSVLLLLDDGAHYGNIGSPVEISTITNSNWFNEFKKNHLSRQFSNLVGRTGQASEDAWGNRYIFLCYPYQNKAFRGDLIFLIPFSVFQGAVTSFEENAMDVILFGRDNMPVYNNTESGNPKIDLEAVKGKILSSTLDYAQISENKNGVDLIGYSQLGGWKLVVNVSNDYIMQNFRGTLYFIFFLQIALIFIFVAALLYLISNRLKPLRAFTKQMKLVTENDLQVHTDIRTGDELETLSVSFNQMIEKIHQYLEEKVKQNNYAKQMEYNLFVAQVDPHFIYKTLNIITYLAETGETKELIQVNTSLITILMDRLRVSHLNVFDTIQKEIDVIDAYLAIQRVRYGNVIRMEKHVEAALYVEPVPKNIIQPLIENAIFHGILLNTNENLEVTGGDIELDIHEEGDSLVIEVKDNGQGMDNETLHKHFEEDALATVNEEERGRHIGIKNIRERLHYLYQDNFSFHAVSSAGVGTKIVLTIPKRRDNHA